MTSLFVQKLIPEAFLPLRKNPTDAGLDFFLLNSYVLLGPGETFIAKTGIAIALPRGTFGLLKPKSSSTINILAGVIDENHHDEIKFHLNNSTKKYMEFSYGDPIGQLIILPVVIPEEIVYVNTLSSFFKRETDGGMDRLK